MIAARGEAVQSCSGEKSDEVLMVIQLSRPQVCPMESVQRLRQTERQGEWSGSMAAMIAICSMMVAPWGRWATIPVKAVTHGANGVLITHDLNVVEPIWHRRLATTACLIQQHALEVKTMIKPEAVFARCLGKYFARAYGSCPQRVFTFPYHRVLPVECRMIQPVQVAPVTTQVLWWPP